MRKLTLLLLTVATLAWAGPAEKRWMAELAAASFWGVPVSALYWCDGKRSLAEVIRLTELEMGPQQFDFVGYFKFLERHGYVEFVRR